MRWQRWVLLIAFSLTASLVATHWVRSPGYMDADYYYAISSRIASGSGFSEPFLWNYLDGPSEIPHPSHLYWMPMASIVASIPQLLLGEGFQTAQIAFLILTALVPGITAFIALQVGASENQAMIAGLFAIFSGFFFPFAVTTDTFSIFMVIGGLFFTVLVKASHSRGNALWIASGVLVGAAHLSRADGILFFVIGAIALLEAPGSSVRHAVSLVLGYVVTMTPWWLHNLTVSGSLMSSGSLRVLWLGSYDELFSFPASQLTPGHLWSNGLGSILEVRFHSLLTDVQSLLVVNGLIFLGPLMIVGAIALRKKPLVRYTFLYLLFLVALMSVVFPFAGARGGIFHSGAAVMPVLWALAPIGLHRAIQYGVDKRGWDPSSANSVFRGASVILACATTIGLFYFRTIGPDSANPAWTKRNIIYREVGNWFQAQDVNDALIAVNNPPGFYVGTGLSAVVIPDGGPDVLLRVVEAYQVGWLVLDMNNPGLKELYADPGLIPWLNLQTRLPFEHSEDILIFRVVPEEIHS